MSNTQSVGLPTRFDFSYRKEFMDKCSEILNSDVTDLIMDFWLVDYMDSAAIGMLVMMHQKASSLGKKIKIQRARGATEELLKMANIEKLIEISK